jgi:hypothetical protein
MVLLVLFDGCSTNIAESCGNTLRERFGRPLQKHGNCLSTQLCAKIRGRAFNKSPARSRAGQELRRKRPTVASSIQSPLATPRLGRFGYPCAVSAIGLTLH